MATRPRAKGRAKDKGKRQLRESRPPRGKGGSPTYIEVGPELTMHVDELPPETFRVRSVEGVEELSVPFRYEVVAVGMVPVGTDDLVGRTARVGIRRGDSGDERWVHGTIVSVSERRDLVEPAFTFVVAAPLLLAGHRRRSRIFIERTIRSMVEAVLDDVGQPHAWRIADSPQLEDAEARPYCVQYDESDLAFIGRLLETEGVSYHFEHAPGRTVLVLSDGAHGFRWQAQPFGPDVAGRQLQVVRAASRVTAGRIEVDDYDWQHPALDLSEQARIEHGHRGLFERHAHHGYRRPEQGRRLATIEAERIASAARWVTAEGTAHEVAAGDRIEIADEHAAARYLVVGVRARAIQGHDDPKTLPYRCTVSAIPESDFTYRPARRTPWPRITGTQTAVVTDDGRGSVVATGADVGCVRLAFRWDRDLARHAREATSCWVRVSQLAAGAGQGALWHPRVGTEVIVEFENGDPDRPIVVGRVYNGEQLPPGHGSETVSTFKTFSFAGSETHHEIAFDDAPGAERLLMHAGRNMKTEVGHDRTTEVCRNDDTLVHGCAVSDVRGNADFMAGGVMRFTSTCGTTFDSEGTMTSTAPRIIQRATGEVVVEVGSSKVTMTDQRILIRNGEQRIIIDDGRIRLLG